MSEPCPAGVCERLAGIKTTSKLRAENAELISELSRKNKLLDQCQVVLTQIMADHESQSVMQEWSDALGDLLTELKEQQS